MYCGECGLQLQEDWHACPRCGAVRPMAEKPPVARRIRRPFIIGAAAALVLLLVVLGLVFAGHSKPTALRGTVPTGSAGASALPTASGPLPSAVLHGPTSVDATGQSTSTAVQSLPPPVEPRPIHLSGTGRTMSDPFTAVGGLTVFRPHYTGQDRFAVELIDARGSSQAVIANSNGRYDGSVGKHLAAGSYRLKIDASAPWDVFIVQPRDHRGHPLPETYPGRGQAFVGPFEAGSSVHLAAQYSGSGNFVVEVLSADGQTQDIAFNKVGDFNGSTVANGLSGAPYYLNVDSEGRWTITVSSS